MFRCYMTADELAYIPSFPPECPPGKPGVYWIPADQGAQIHLVLVVKEGIANTLCEVIRVADHAEREKRVHEDTAAFAAVQHGSVAEQIMKLAPEYLNELMAEFIKKKDLPDRQKIRRRVRALLDLFSADTKWPNGQPEPDVQGRGARGNLGMYQGVAPARFGGADRPAEDLMEPPQVDAVPAPGAELAQ